MKWRQRIGNRSSLAVVVVLGIGLLSARAAAADAEEVARKHAAKANQLAARNKCRKAIFEFTRAYKTLKDPTLLFNRAECFRKVGRDDEAITDYEQFLAELPKAPNRVAIEARIASLRGAKGGAPAGKEKPALAPPALLKPAEKAPPPAAVAPTTKPVETGAAATSAPGPKPTPFSEPEPAGKPGAAASASAPKAGDRPAGAPAAAATPAAKPTDKPAAPAAAAKPAEKAPGPSAAPAVKPADNAAPEPAQPARRAEKWTE